MQQLFQQVEQACIRTNTMDMNSFILFACSGGQDSMSLLFIFYQLKIRWGWKIGVLHANHLWRSTAVIHASELTEICLSLGLEIYVSLPGKLLDEEQSGRLWRTRSTIRIAQMRGWGVISTAHTASDRVETLLGNLFRGTSGYSAGSINWYRVGPIPLVRPILGISRRSLRSYSDFWHLPLLVDETNQDVRIRRNRIRYELLPYLRQSCNPQVDRLLVQTTELHNLDALYLDFISHQICQQYEWICYRGVRFPWYVLKATPKSLQLRLLYTFLIRATTFLVPKYNFECDMEFLQSILLSMGNNRWNRDHIIVSSTTEWLVFSCVY
jgi:tRNA(Ile)-lysidine synthase